MKHLATIQVEFLKEARNWDEMSLQEQKAYLKQHPQSKRRLTGKLTKDTGKKQQKNRPDSLAGELAAKRLELELKDKPFKELADKFNKDGYETVLTFDGPDNKRFLSVQNPKGYSIDFKQNDKGSFDGIVQGYNSDIHLGDVGRSYKDLKEVAKAINKSWMKENDPGGERW